jgi:hypothetical protein
MYDGLDLPERGVRVRNLQCLRCRTNIVCRHLHRHRHRHQQLRSLRHGLRIWSKLRVRRVHRDNDMRHWADELQRHLHQHANRHEQLRDVRHGLRAE